MSDDLVSEDQFIEDAEKFADLSLTKRKHQRQGQDGKHLREQTEEQPSVVVNDSGVCLDVVYALLLF